MYICISQIRMKYKQLLDRLCFQQIGPPYTMPYTVGVKSLILDKAIISQEYIHQSFQHIIYN